MVQTPLNALRVSQHPCLYLCPLVRKTRAAGAIYFCIGEISNRPPNPLPRSLAHQGLEIENFAEG
jgi:hypothetical protein